MFEIFPEILAMKMSFVGGKWKGGLIVERGTGSQNHRIMQILRILIHAANPDLTSIPKTCSTVVPTVTQTPSAPE
ncbi:MAG TPA: hypothetical protein DDX19_12575 [Rhodopirellula baltica]|nr:hypothetical protein [Rhodopirellula baltica]